MDGLMASHSHEFGTANLRDSTSVTSKGSEPMKVEKLPAKTCRGILVFQKQRCGENPIFSS